MDLEQNISLSSSPPPPSPIFIRSSEKIGRVEQMKTIQNEGLELFKKKNQDYGDAFATYGPIGVLVRMGDKISRLQSITTNNITLVDTEGLRDTLIDLHNYSAMAIMLLDEKPNTTTTNSPESNNMMNCPEMSWNFTKYKTDLPNHIKDILEQSNKKNEEIEEVD